MRALVTGATGFLGRRVVSDLLARCHEVRCFLRKSSSIKDLPEAPERFEIVRGELADEQACLAALEGCDAVYHIAAEMKGATAVLFLGNVVATRALVSAALRSRVKRFVLVSSLGVYGTAAIPDGGTLDESCPLDASAHRRDPYSYSKNVQERVCWDAYSSSGLPLVVVRPGVIYGPGRDFLTARVGLRVGNCMLIMGGKQPMPYTHVANCANGVVIAGLMPGVEGQAFNLIDDELPTGRQLVAAYRSQVGWIRRFRVPRWAVGPLSGVCEWYHRASRGQIPAVLTSYKSQAMWSWFRYPNDRAKSGLGWKPAVGLQEGLKETIEWLKSQGTRGMADSTST